MATLSTSLPGKHAVLYRMVMPEHICPFGLKARWLLKHYGYTVEDHWLTTRAGQDAFKAEHDVKTTPQAFIAGERVGGFDDLRRFFGLSVADPKATSYWPVVAVFAVAAAIALAIDWLTGAPLVGLVGAGRFIATAMCLLAMLKLQDVDRFATMFLGYDLLARAYVPYAYAYPFRGVRRWCADAGGGGELAVGAGRDGDRVDRRGLRHQGGLCRQTRAQVRLRRRKQ